ncbi:MAG: amidohydrolase family protein [Gammaproteobacteria bacterium]|nr:amidohydrolase family protein [Gammaproteobacteria bacterium]
MKFFDSLIHVQPDGGWLNNKDDSGIDRLLQDIDGRDYRACLVAIAGYQRNEDLVTLSMQHPELFVPIAGFNPVAYDSTAERQSALTSLAATGFPGIKLHPRLNEYDPLDPCCLETIEYAGQAGLIVFLDTLFRQKGRVTAYAPDVVDRIVNDCNPQRLVLLHGGASSLLDMFEMVRMHENLILDLSFTLMRYAGSSLDQDLAFVCRELDQRVVVGSDYPEYLPSDARQRIGTLMDGLPLAKRENVLYANLERLFAGWGGLKSNRI